MKIKTILFSLLLTAFSVPLFSSCENESKAEEIVEEVGADIDNASESVADAFRSESAELKADLKDTRQKIDTRLEELGNDLDDASDEAKAEIKAEMDRLEQWGNEVDGQLDRLGEDIEASWQSFKSESRETLNEINRELTKVMQ